MSRSPSSPAVTQKDIAQKLGLSQSSVSKALKDDPEIERTTRDRVHAAARELGYRPNPMGTGLAHFKQTSKVKPVEAALAWINAWPDPKKLRSYREFDLYWRGASRAAENFGYRLDEFVVNKAMPLPRIEKTLRARGINGILIPPHGAYDVAWDAMHWEGFSAVRFGHSTQGLPPFHSVTAAQAGNTALAFSRMREHGYERIGFVGTARTSSFLQGFLYRQFQEPMKMRIPPLLASPNRKNFVPWLERYKPDAILTETTDIPALLKKARYRVPDDIAVAGTTVFDIPGIDAGIDQHPEEIGRVATLVVISLINDHDRSAPAIQREVLIKGDWMDGKSLPPCG
jgi:DNA-binding LacI/PurR family transcriptional regulator